MTLLFTAVVSTSPRHPCSTRLFWGSTRFEALKKRPALQIEAVSPVFSGTCGSGCLLETCGGMGPSGREVRGVRIFVHELEMGI